MALAMLFMIGLSAMAQVTTGSIVGTVKDAQGGVVPGATVTLTSETKGTTSAPAITTVTGDFQFPVTPVDTYTVEITMDSFKTLKQSGVAVNPGSRTVLGTLVLEVGGTTETVVVKAESPLIQSTSGERSFTVPTDSVQNLPFANRGFTTLAALAPGVTGTTAQGTQNCMSSNIVMDGVSTMDTGSSGSALFNMNTESIAEVKVLESGYQAEYGLAQRPAGPGGHEERDEPVPRILLQCAPQLGLERQQQGQQFQWRAQDRIEGAGHRVLDRRPYREAGRPQQAVLLLRRGVQPRDRRRHAADVPAADRAGAAGRFLADHR